MVRRAETGGQADLRARPQTVALVLAAAAVAVWGWALTFDGVVLAPRSAWLAFAISALTLALADRLAATIQLGGSRIAISSSEVGMVVCLACLAPRWSLTALVVGELIGAATRRPRLMVGVLHSAPWLAVVGLGTVVSQLLAANLGGREGLSPEQGWAISVVAAVVVAVSSIPIGVSIGRLARGSACWVGHATRNSLLYGIE